MLHGLSILAVDDELAPTLDRQLRTLGASPVTCKDLRSAKATLATMPFHCAVIDMLLPNGNGAQWIRDLRLSAPDLPCVLVTGVDTKAMGADPGCVVLEKPFSRAALEGAIVSAIVKMEKRP